MYRGLASKRAPPLHEHAVGAVTEGLEPRNAVDRDDHRAMNADEARRIEPRLERLHRLAQEMRAPLGGQRHVVAIGARPLDRVGADEVVPLRRADGEAARVAPALAQLLDERQQVVPARRRTGARQTTIDAREHLVEALPVHRLHEIIHRAHLEGLQREPVVRRDEDDGRRLLAVEQRVRDLHARVTGHADVEEGKVGALALHRVERLVAVRALGHDRPPLVPREQEREPLACQRLIVRHDHAPLGSHRSSSRRGRRTSATVPRPGAPLSSSRAASPYSSLRRCRVLARPTPLPLV